MTIVHVMILNILYPPLIGTLAAMLYVALWADVIFIPLFASTDAKPSQTVFCKV